MGFYKRRSAFYVPLVLLAIGSLPSFALNVDDDDGGINLVGSTYTRTDVSSFADIAYDIRDMEGKCAQNDISAARQIYRNGKTAIHSLSSLATNPKFKHKDLTFAFQMYGLAGGDGKVVNGNVLNYESFAHEYIEQLFDDKKCFTAIRAIHHLGVWMHVSYLLWNTVISCDIAADPDYDNAAAGVDNMPFLADQIVASWVGSLQQNNGAEDDDGFSLYSETNRIGDIFGTNLVGGARANLNLLEGYEAISEILSIDTSCQDNNIYANTIEAMWPTVTEMSRQMLIPQIQFLIHSMLEEDYDAVGIHARIVVPQASQCRTSSYEYLKQTFLDNPYDSSKFHRTLAVLQDLYACFGISCLEIGIPIDFSEDNALFCHHYYFEYPSLAGYPASTDVSEDAKIDLDVHQINILTQFDDGNEEGTNTNTGQGGTELNHETYWKLAQYIYMNGKNSRKFHYYQDDDDVTNEALLSLHSLAVSGARKNTYYYLDFITYFDDANFADSTIRDTFNNRGRWKNRSLKQRAAVIRVTIQVHLMHMHILTKLDDSVTACGKNNEKIDSARIDLVRDDDDNFRFGRMDSWDEVSAFIIGSMEGQKYGGSPDFRDGALLWSLANNRCIEFGLCTTSNDHRSAIVNKVLYDQLAAGKAMFEAGSCENLQRITEDLANVLLVPILQSVIKYAIVNQYQNRGSSDVSIALGETFATGIIPIVLRYDEKSGMTLNKNLVPVDNFEELVMDGPQVVADTFLAIPYLGCGLIGKSYEVDACLNYQDTSTSGIAKSTELAFSIILTSILAVVSLI